MDINLTLTQGTIATDPTDLSSTTEVVLPESLSSDSLLALQDDLQRSVIETAAKSNVASSKAHTLSKMTHYLNMV